VLLILGMNYLTIRIRMVQGFRRRSFPHSPFTLKKFMTDLELPYPVSERVGAFIIRKTPHSLYELLLFHAPDRAASPLQIPGGGVDPGETLESALHREIHEESGLTDLILIRKLGMIERCWLDTRMTTRRHYFLLQVITQTRDRWDHIVHGTGADAGMRFSYFWHHPTLDFTLEGGSAAFLNPIYLPELYD